MAVFRLEIECDNAAFEEREHEVARILQYVAKRVRDGETGAVVRDLNGNTVGEYRFS